MLTALTTAKDYIVRVLARPGRAHRRRRARRCGCCSTRTSSTSSTRASTSPAADGRHAATGWLVRFDPAEVALADPEIRVQGTLRVAETRPDTLEVTADHTFVYALRPAGADARRRGRLAVHRPP